jgi:putative ABC transport system substrate-binding protein
MRRRELLAGIGATAAWPISARALQRPLPVVAYVGVGSADAFAGNVAAFRKGLGETGYVEDRNVTVEYHWLEGQYDRLPAQKEGEAQPATWAIEMGGPGGLARQGWRPKTLTPGMPVTLTIHPLRDGTNGGQFMTATLPDGTKLGAGAGQVVGQPPAQQN